MQEKTEYQSLIFANRIKKNYKELKKWARKNKITCFRIYDRDIPEIPLSLDLYEFLPEGITSVQECSQFLFQQNERISQNDLSIEKEIKNRIYAVLHLYERPKEHQKTDEEEKIWLSMMEKSVAEVLNIQENHIITKTRKMQKGLNQYEKSDTEKISGLIQENTLLFKVDLTSYIDTGIFFDLRPLKMHILKTSKGKTVLNLFCYTSSFSVYAAAGEAKKIENVDLSNTYLNWSKQNMAQNGFSDEKKYTYTKSDCIKFIQSAIEKNARYDIIILDPPTFSNSKSTENILDINRDWQKLVNDCIKLLSEEGTLYFSSNSTRLKFDKNLIQNNKNLEITDITQNTIPKDFEGKNCHKAYKIIRHHEEF